MSLALIKTACLVEIRTRLRPLSGYTAVVCFFAFLCFIPFAIYDALHFRIDTAGCTQWICILYYGIIVTVAAFVLWFRGLTAVPAGTASVFTGFMPVSAVVLSGVLLKERITPVHLLSLALVLGGILLTALFPTPSECGRKFEQTLPAKKLSDEKLQYTD